MSMRRAAAARSCSSLSAAFTRFSSRSNTSTELSSSLSRLSTMGSFVGVPSAGWVTMSIVLELAGGSDERDATAPVGSPDPGSDPRGREDRAFDGPFEGPFEPEPVVWRSACTAE